MAVVVSGDGVDLGADVEVLDAEVVTPLGNRDFETGWVDLLVAAVVILVAEVVVDLALDSVMGLVDGLVVTFEQ